MTNTPSFRVRAFTPDDRDGLVALWTLVFPDDPARNAPERVIDRKLRLRDELLLVAVVDGVVVGAIMGGYDGFRGWLYHLAVAPEYRRRGCGTQLVHEAESRLRSRGCSKVNLQLRASNSQVARFYAALGYNEEPRVSMGRVL